MFVVAHFFIPTCAERDVIELSLKPVFGVLGPGRIWIPTMEQIISSFGPAARLIVSATKAS